MGLQIQERDLRLFADLADACIMDFPTIWTRHFSERDGKPSDEHQKACGRRLRLLIAAGLLVKVKLPEGYPGPAIYALTRQGADMLLALRGIEVRRMLTDPPGLPTLLHRLGVGRMLLTFNDACERHQFPRPPWILEQDTIPGVGPKAHPSERFVLYEVFPLTTEGETIPCRPDASCLLSIPHSSPSGEPQTIQVPIYWEYDRSTMTRERMEKKPPGYEALLSSYRYRKHWPQVAETDRVRICFVVPSEERLRNLADTYRPSRVAAYFRFATLADFSPARLLTETVWQDVNGNRYALYRPPKPSGS